MLRSRNRNGRGKSGRTESGGKAEQKDGNEASHLQTMRHTVSSEVVRRVGAHLVCRAGQPRLKARRIGKNQYKNRIPRCQQIRDFWSVIYVFAETRRPRVAALVRNGRVNLINNEGEPPDDPAGGGGRNRGNGAGRPQPPARRLWELPPGGVRHSNSAGKILNIVGVGKGNFRSTARRSYFLVASAPGWRLRGQDGARHARLGSPGGGMEPGLLKPFWSPRSLQDRCQPASARVPSTGPHRPRPRPASAGASWSLPLVPHRFVSFPPDPPLKKPRRTPRRP